MNKPGYGLITMMLCLMVVSGCNGPPKNALMLGPESLQMRQMQTRKYDTSNEKNILSASAALLQDLGFTLDESETKLGVIVGSKTRDATDTVQATFALMNALLSGTDTPIDKEQLMRASLVTRPLENGRQVAVRITFQRIVINTHNQVTHQAAIEDPAIYQEFFSKLSKSIFLEAHQI